MGVERVDIGRVGALLLPASGIPLKERSPYSSVANNTVLTTRGSGSDITMERERSLVPWRQRRKCPGPVGAPETQPSHSAGRYHRGISPGTRSWNMITRSRRGLSARQSGGTTLRQVRVCGVVLQRHVSVTRYQHRSFETGKINKRLATWFIKLSSGLWHVPTLPTSPPSQQSANSSTRSKLFAAALNYGKLV